MLWAHGAGQPAVGGKQKAGPLLAHRVGLVSCAWHIGPVKGNVQTSFLLPAYNEEALVARAVNSIHEAAKQCAVNEYEIIVCDNASTDATARIARECGARVVHEPHRQIARARNAAAAASTGSWLVWLDSDAILSAEVLNETLSAFRDGGFCGGGAQVELEGEALSWSAQRTVDSWNWIARTFRFAAGSYVFAHRQAWADTGGFDESVYAGEEIGFSRALKKWGSQRGLSFRVIDRAVPSSARKLRQFTVRQTLWQMAVCLWPGNLGRRDRLHFWYERREEVEG
ncbi:MAG: glycosyltransferase family 2 protein [Chthoniobacterales bacterium]